MADLPCSQVKTSVEPPELYRLADQGMGHRVMQSVENPAWHSTYEGEWVRWSDVKHLFLQRPVEADRPSNEQLAHALQPELERAGWTLSLGSITAVLEALNFHRRATETDVAPYVEGVPCPRCSAFVKANGGPSQVFHSDGPCPPYLTGDPTR